MGTIDGTSVEIKTVTFITTSKTVVNQAGSGDSNNVAQSGYDGLKIQLDCVAYSLSAYDAIVACVMPLGSHVLVVRSGWQYTVYNLDKRIALEEGYTDNYFRFALNLQCADPYQYSTTENEFTRTITSNGIEFTQDDTANDIETTGTVAAKPDFKITAAGSLTATLLKQTNKFT